MTKLLRHREGISSQQRRGRAGGFSLVGNVYYHHLLYGQSNNIGSTGAQAASAISTSPHATSKMFNGGVRAHLDTPALADQNFNVDVRQMASAADLVEALNPNAQPWGETKAYGWASADPTRRHVFASMAANTAGIGSLGPGSTHFTNLMLSASYMRRCIVAFGGTYQLGVLGFDQGEADAATTAYADYLAALAALRNDVVAYLSAQLGIVVPSTLPTIIKQNANHGGTYGRDVARAQLQFARDNVGVVAIDPDYWSMTSGDPTNRTSANHKQKGRKEGQIAKAMLDGGTWRHMDITAAVRTGTSLDVTLYVPFGNAAIDTTTLTDPGQYGFTYTDGASADVAMSSFALGATVANVAHLTCTLASGVAGTLRAGMHTTSDVATNRTNLRDSDPSGLHNWLCASEWAVT